MFDMSGNLIISNVINNSYNHTASTVGAVATAGSSMGLVYNHASSSFSSAGATTIGATGPGPNYIVTDVSDFTVGATGPGPNYIVTNNTFNAVVGSPPYMFHDE